MTGLVSSKFKTICKKCNNPVDYLWDGNQKYIIGFRCTKCGREWRVI